MDRPQSAKNFSAHASSSLAISSREPMNWSYSKGQNGRRFDESQADWNDAWKDLAIDAYLLPLASVIRFPYFAGVLCIP